MEWIEVSAWSLDEAVELALDRLGVVEDELEYEVIDEAKSGFLRRREARIRARVKPLSREKPSDRRRRSRRPERSSQGSSGRGREATKTATRPSGGNERKSGANAGAAGAGAAAGEGSTGTPRRRRSRGGRGGGGNGGNGQNGAGQDKNSTRSRTEAEGDVVDGGAQLTIDEQATSARQFAGELVEAFGIPAAVDAEIVEDDIELRITGENLGILVGPKGATLHALEELTRAALQHAAGGHSARLHLDVAGYRERRRAALAAFVTQVADEVRESGNERALEPMSPPDRKVVHDTISELDGVGTMSVGEEPRRRVVITPA